MLRVKIVKEKQNESPLRYIIAIVIIILVVLGAFQLGIVGQMIDSFFNYLFGMSRFLTYILVILGTVFITYSKKFLKRVEVLVRLFCNLLCYV